MFEYFAGIVGRRDAFFPGYAEIISRNEHLNLSFQLYDGEKTESNQKAAASDGKQISADHAGNGSRKSDRSRGAIFIFLDQAAVEHDGGYDLDDGSRAVGSENVAVEGRLGTEYFYVPFASVKNYFFGEKGDASDAVGGRDRGVVRGKIDQEIECHVYGIKSAVKGNGFYFQKHVKYLDAFGFYGHSPVNFRLFDCRKIDRKVL